MRLLWFHEKFPPFVSLVGISLRHISKTDYSLGVREDLGKCVPWKGDDVHINGDCKVRKLPRNLTAGDEQAGKSQGHFGIVWNWIGDTRKMASNWGPVRPHNLISQCQPVSRDQTHIDVVDLTAWDELGRPRDILQILVSSSEAWGACAKGNK